MNGVHYDQIIKSDFYPNTAGHSTQFYNAKGLRLEKGSTLNGVEVDANGGRTGNGGSVFLNSPNGVVRVDGDIDVRALDTNKNGGNVRIDAAYLYQSGNIMASGNGSGRGGAVNINVNSATFLPGATIDVTKGTGGSININSTGVIDIKNGAQMLVSGLHGSESDVIQIATGFLSNSGVIKAEGVSTEDNSQSGGGVIHLTGRSYINLQPVADAVNKSGFFTPCQAKAVIADLRHTVLQYPQEDRYSAIVNNGTISANGSDETNSAFTGGKGGQITMNTLSLINTGKITANGGAARNDGGAGGSITTDSFKVDNSGTIAVNGGDTTTGKSFGGAGGSVDMHVGATSSFLNQKGGVISANGGSGLSTATLVQQNGGAGGTLNLRSNLNLKTNQNLGTFSAKGGNGNPGYRFSLGGKGGNINTLNIQPVQGSVNDVSGGSGNGGSGDKGNFDPQFTQ